MRQYPYIYTVYSDLFCVQLSKGILNMKKCAVIDIGSNTIRLCAYQYEGENIQDLLNRKKMAQLASYVKKGELSGEGIHTACLALESFKTILENIGIDDFHAFATASLRNITNTADVLSAIESETGIKVDVISGEEEGRLSLRGAVESVNVADGLLVDLGGGSTEIVPFTQKKARAVYSLKSGSLTLYRKFVGDFLPDKKECKSIDEYYRGLIREEKIKIPESDIICGVGGSFRAIAKLIDHMSDRPEGTFEFTNEELEFLYKKLKCADRAAKDLLLQVVPDRIHTVIPAIIAIRVIMDEASCKKVRVSRTGVREGYMFAKVLNM